MNKESLLNYFRQYKELETDFQAKKNNSLTQSKVKLELAEEEMKDAFKNLKLAIIHELRKNNDFYQKIQRQNSELISNNSFEVKVIKVIESPGVNDKFSTRFEGGIFPNGYLYFKSVETNKKFTLESYASHLSGSIDEHGAGTVAEKNTKVGIIKTLPALYNGKITANGRINMEVMELDSSFEPRLIAFHLAGDPFNRSEKRRKLFLRNRAEMNRLISENLEELQKLCAKQK